MKTLFRILIILVITSIIGGLMYAGVSAAGATSFEGERPQMPEGAEFRPEREEHGERDGLDIPGGMVKALVLMSIAGGVYSGVVWAGKKTKQVSAR
jgi:orotate phosphoribosyltransferase